MKLADGLVGAGIAAFGLYVLLTARTFPHPVGQLYGGGLFPSVVGVGLITLGVALVIRDRVRRPASALVLADWARRPVGPLRMLALIAGALAFVLAMPVTGFLATAIPTVFALQLILGARPFVALIVSVAGPIVVWYVFSGLLRIALPYGVFEALLP